MDDSEIRGMPRAACCACAGFLCLWMWVSALFVSSGCGGEAVDKLGSEQTHDAGMPQPTITDAGKDGKGPEGPDAAPDATGPTVDPEVRDAGPRAGWTVLVYMAADNNLERSAMDDLAEMARVEGGKDLNIVVQVDRAVGYYGLGVGNLPNWTTAKRLAVQGRSLVELADLGERNTGEPQALADFIDFGVRSYPAEHYMLVLWNHGNSWIGYGGDESEPGGDHLTLDELAVGVRTGMAQSGLAQFDLLGFDACLMATYDVLPVMAPFGRYLLASEELEPGHGWDYTKLAGIAEQPQLSATELGRLLADGFFQQARTAGTQASVTLALLDLTGVPQLAAAVTDLTGSFDDVVGQAPRLGEARAKTLTFGRHADPKRAYNVIDIGDFADQLGDRLPALAEQRDAVKAALDRLVVYQVTGRLMSKASGASIYFPSEQAYYQADYDKVSGSAPWRSLLGDYYTLPMQAARTPRFVDGRLSSVGGGESLAPGLCGDHVCQTRQHETPANCAQDCLGSAVSYDHATCDSLALLPASPTRPVRTQAVCHEEYMLQCFLEGDTLRPRLLYCPDAGRTCRAAWDDPLAPGSVPPGTGCVIPSGTGQVICDASGSLVIEGQLTQGSVDVTSEARLMFGYYVYFEQRPVIFGTQPATFDASGKVRGKWNQQVLTVEQGGTQQLLFAETKIVDGVAYHEVPLVYRPPVACPCLLRGEPGFADTDGDALPDCADQDVDGDGLLDKEGQLDVIAADNCPWAPNPSQEDADKDGVGDACEADSRKPVLVCEPASGNLNVVEQTAFWRVTTDLATQQSTAKTLYVRSPTGVAELYPEPGGRLSPMFYKQGVKGWQWEVGEPLLLDLNADYAFRYATIEMPALDASGVPTDDADGKPISLRQRERLNGYYLELQALNFAGKGDSVFQFGKSECATATTSCPAGQLTDCKGQCRAASLVGDRTCDDGLREADFDCFAHGYDGGDCLIPACTDGRMRTCSLSCLAVPEELGDGRCDQRLNCLEHQWDGGDCSCPNQCSGHGSCVSGSCRCDGGYRGPACETPPSCGDGACQGPDESCLTCPADCTDCQTIACGDGVCQARAGDTCENCPGDCGTCACGDGVCTTSLETCKSCSKDCGACPSCGDGVCQRYAGAATPFALSAAENCGVCPQDCGLCLGRCCYSSDDQGQNFVGGGCQLPDVAQCVCKTDPTCCLSAWPDRCVQIARSSCALKCDSVPSGWTCPDVYFGDSTCDCGCGVRDSDCRSSSAAACRFDGCPSGQSRDDADPTQCVAGIVSEAMQGFSRE